MENNNANGAPRRPDEKNVKNENKAPSQGHGRGRHHHRRPHKPASEAPVAQSMETDIKQAKAPVTEEKSAKPQQPQGDRSRSRGGRGNPQKKGKGAGDRVPAEQSAAPEEQKNAKRGKGGRDSRAGSSDVGSLGAPIAPALTAELGNHFFDDSFLPIHEETRPDPDADRYAASVLDAEGPLLFREQPAPAVVEGSESAPEEIEEPVPIVGIRFRRTGKVYFFDPGELVLRVGQFAVVETARGLEYGEVYRANSTVPAKEIVLPLRPVVRVATPEDTRHHEENKNREMEAFRICQEKIAAHGLDMKLVEAEFTFDNTKLLFYFTSAGRVDFRELVKDLAGVFRTRIELRQIGIRDEAKILGGLGTCGRPLCCASFLADFVQVSIKMAKEQNLSLNSTKISGCCGRLMCCLRYESDTYEEAIRLTPSVGSLVETPDGQGNVTSTVPLRGMVTVRLGDQADAVSKTYHRDDIRVLQRASRHEEE